MRTRILFLVIALLLISPLASAVEPDEMLKDPALEARARAISKELRCLVCQNESIDDSNARLAHDLRLLVRARLKAGDTNQQVKDYIVARYGEFVLLKPRVEPRTWLLWFGPALVLLIGAGGVAAYLVRRNRAPAAVEQAPLSAAEQARLTRILAEDGESGRRT